MTRCLAPDCQMGGLGCDNMTVVLICFLHDKQYEDLADKCAIPFGLKNNAGPLSSSSSTTSTDDDELATNDAKMMPDHENETLGEETYSKLNASADNGLAVA